MQLWIETQNVLIIETCISYCPIVLEWNLKPIQCLNKLIILRYQLSGWLHLTDYFHNGMWVDVVIFFSFCGGKGIFLSLYLIYKPYVKVCIIIYIIYT